MVLQRGLLTPRFLSLWKIWIWETLSKADLKSINRVHSFLGLSLSSSLVCLMVSTYLRMLTSQPIFCLKPVWDELSLYTSFLLMNEVSCLFKMRSMILYMGEVMEMGLQFSNLCSESLDLGRYICLIRFYFDGRSRSLERR